MSEGGLFLATSALAEKGARIYMRVFLPRMSEPIKVIGQVVRVVFPSDAALPGMGVRFEAAYAQAHPLATFIQSLAGGQGSAAPKAPQPQVEAMPDAEETGPQFQVRFQPPPITTQGIAPPPPSEVLPTEVLPSQPQSDRPSRPPIPKRTAADVKRDFAFEVETDWRNRIIVATLLVIIGCAVGGYLYLRPKPTMVPLATRDYVLYRYSGSFTPEPVVIRQEVVERTGNEVTIDVVAKRGSQERHWIEVVTDSEDNRGSGVVKQLYEIVGNERKQLANPDNRDLLRLRSWVALPGLDAHPTDVDVAAQKARVADGQFRCTVSTGKSSILGRPIRFTEHICPDFTWLTGPARYWDVETDTDIWRIEVLGFGKTQ